jgi:hypothetical protein
VRGDILKRYENVKPALMERVSRLSGGVGVSVDGWTSESQRRNYIAIEITFIERWERKIIPLCMKSTESESHTGDVIANLVFNELKEFKLILQNWVREKSFLLDNVAAAEARGRGSGGAQRNVMILILTFGWRKIFSLVRKSSRGRTGLHFTHMSSNFCLRRLLISVPSSSLTGYPRVRPAVQVQVRLEAPEWFQKLRTHWRSEQGLEWS